MLIRLKRPERSAFCRIASSATKDKIINYYRENNLVLVIDDFHYAPEGKRMQIAQQLKDAIRRGFKAISRNS